MWDATDRAVRGPRADRRDRAEGGNTAADAAAAKAGGVSASGKRGAVGQSVVASAPASQNTTATAATGQPPTQGVTTTANTSNTASAGRAAGTAIAPVFQRCSRIKFVSRRMSRGESGAAAAAAATTATPSTPLQQDQRGPPAVVSPKKRPSSPEAPGGGGGVCRTPPPPAAGAAARGVPGGASSSSAGASSAQQQQQQQHHHHLSKRPRLAPSSEGGGVAVAGGYATSPLVVPSAVATATTAAAATASPTPAAGETLSEAHHTLQHRQGGAAGGRVPEAAGGGGIRGCLPTQDGLGGGVPGGGGGGMDVTPQPAVPCGEGGSGRGCAVDRGVATPPVPPPARPQGPRSYSLPSVAPGGVRQTASAASSSSSAPSSATSSSSSSTAVAPHPFPTPDDLAGLTYPSEPAGGSTAASPQHPRGGVTPPLPPPCAPADPASGIPAQRGMGVASLPAGGGAARQSVGNPAPPPPDAMQLLACEAHRNPSKDVGSGSTLPRGGGGSGGGVTQQHHAEASAAACPGGGGDVDIADDDDAGGVGEEDDDDDVDDDDDDADDGYMEEDEASEANGGGLQLPAPLGSHFAQQCRGGSGGAVEGRARTAALQQQQHHQETASAPSRDKSAVGSVPEGGGAPLPSSRQQQQQQQQPQRGSGSQVPSTATPSNATPLSSLGAGGALGAQQQQQQLSDASLLQGFPSGVGLGGAVPPAAGVGSGTAAAAAVGKEVIALLKAIKAQFKNGVCMLEMLGTALAQLGDRSGREWFVRFAHTNTGGVPLVLAAMEYHINDVGVLETAAQLLCALIHFNGKRQLRVVSKVVKKGGSRLICSILVLHKAQSRVLFHSLCGILCSIVPADPRVSSTSRITGALATLLGILRADPTAKELLVPTLTCICSLCGKCSISLGNIVKKGAVTALANVCHTALAQRPLSYPLLKYLCKLLWMIVKVEENRVVCVREGLVPSMFAIVSQPGVTTEIQLCALDIVRYTSLHPDGFRQFESMGGVSKLVNSIIQDTNERSSSELLDIVNYLFTFHSISEMPIVHEDEICFVGDRSPPPPDDTSASPTPPPPSAHQRNAATASGGTPQPTRGGAPQRGPPPLRPSPSSGSRNTAPGVGGGGGGALDQAGISIGHDLPRSPQEGPHLPTYRSSGTASVGAAVYTQYGTAFGGGVAGGRQQQQQQPRSASGGDAAPREQQFSASATQAPEGCDTASAPPCAPSTPPVFMSAFSPELQADRGDCWRMDMDPAPQQRQASHDDPAGCLDVDMEGEGKDDIIRVHHVRPFDGQRCPSCTSVLDDSPKHIEGGYTPPPNLLSCLLQHDLQRLTRPEHVMGTVVYDDVPRKVDPPPLIFGRIEFGGAKAFEASPIPPLKFSSNFESGNLKRAVRVYDAEYDLILNSDVGTAYHTQWFYFSVSGMVPNVPYKFNIINLEKVASLFNAGQRPVVFSEKEFTKQGTGWRRDGFNIAYARNPYKRRMPLQADLDRVAQADAQANKVERDSVMEDVSDAPGTAKRTGKRRLSHVDAEESGAASGADDSECAARGGAATKRLDQKSQKAYYTLTFTVKFKHPEDTCYIAHSYPYTYSDLQNYMNQLPVKYPQLSNFTRKQVLCKTLGKNDVHLLTITTLKRDDGTEVPPEEIAERKVCFISARVHPGETCASWVLKGLLDTLMDPASYESRYLRDNLVFKVIPMLNPDGVINGNHRCSLSGRDLNREWHSPSAHLTPPVYYFKHLIKHVKNTERRDVLLFTDFHGHSKHKNFFMYGCNVMRKGVPATPSLVLEKVLPKLVQNLTPSYSADNTSFKVQKSKESTGRVVVWRELGVRLSYTVEASLMGSDALPVLRPDDLTLEAKGGAGAGAAASGLPAPSSAPFPTKPGHFNTLHYQSVGAVFCRCLRPFIGNEKDTPAILALGETVHQLCQAWNIANGTALSAGAGTPQTAAAAGDAGPSATTTTTAARRGRGASSGRKAAGGGGATAGGGLTRSSSITRGRGTGGGRAASKGAGGGRAAPARAAGRKSSVRSVPLAGGGGGGSVGVGGGGGGGGGAGGAVAGEPAALALSDDDDENDDDEDDEDEACEYDNDTDAELERAYVGGDDGPVSSVGPSPFGHN